MSDLESLAEPVPVLSTQQAAVAAPARPWEFDAGASQKAAGDLKGRTVRSALVSTVAQGAALVLRTGSIILLSRLLVPRDFGLVAMATTVTGFLSLFRDFGLSTASVQREGLTEDQASVLFWINLLVGAALAAACGAMAPVLVRFYGEPRLLLVTVALAAGFVFNGASVQHRALLQRQMRFACLAGIDTIALILAIVVSASMAVAGFGHWAVVAMAVCPQMVGAIGVWLTAGWMPGRPTRHSGVLGVLRYGGTVTLNTVVVYVAYNADKVLLGRVWGPEALGLYSRAYQLISLATESLNSAVSQVALPALARVQNDPPRCRRYFLLGYGGFLSLAVPLSVACAFFAEDIIRVFLGAKWMDAAGIFRLLTPTMFAFAVVNPLGWLMLATGRAGRSLGIALLIAPVTIAGFALGLPAGAQGVAIGFSAAMLLLVVPIALWARRGMALTGRDVLGEVMPPLVSAVAGGVVGYVAAQWLQDTPPFLRLIVESGAFLGVFLTLLLFVFGRKSVYLTLLSDANLIPASLRRRG